MARDPMVRLGHRHSGWRVTRVRIADRTLRRLGTGVARELADNVHDPRHLVVLIAERRKLGAQVTAQCRGGDIHG